MCRELSHPNHRRCPSSFGENRNSRDRAKYAANKASGLTKPVNKTITEAPEVFIEISLEDAAEQVRERIHTTFHVSHGKNLGNSKWDPNDVSLRAANYYESWADIENDVRSVGQSVENRAAEIAGFTAEEVAERHLARVEMVNNRMDPLNAKIEAARQELGEALSERTRLWMENPETNVELEDRINKLQSRLDSRIADGNMEALAILSECGFGKDLNPSTFNSALAKIQQGADPATLAETKALADARLVALREIRDFGGAIDLNDNSSKRVVGIMAEVAEHYPADWIRLSNEAGNLKVKDTKGRAHYSQSRSQKVRKQSTEMTWRTPDDAPDGDGWTQGVWTGNGWADPYMYPDAAEKYADKADSIPTDRRVAWYRPAFKTRKSYRYFDGESVTGPPPRGWTEAFETLSDGREIRVFRQPAWRMTTAETVSELTVDKDRPAAQWQETAGLGTALHEFGHRAEHMNQAIMQLEEAFLQRRTTDENGERDRLVNIYGSGRERGRTDSFADKYMGKEYSNGYREVLSTGMEALFSGAYGSLAGINGKTPDADMRAFVLGVLATA